MKVPWNNVLLAYALGFAKPVLDSELENGELEMKTRVCNFKPANFGNGLQTPTPHCGSEKAGGEGVGAVFTCT